MQSNVQSRVDKNVSGIIMIKKDLHLFLTIYQKLSRLKALILLQDATANKLTPGQNSLIWDSWNAY